MYRNKKRLWWVLLGFFIMVLTGTVYAAANSFVLISGAVTLESTAKLQLEYPSNDTSNVQSARGTGSGRLIVDPDGQTATIEVTLTEPGDSVTLYYNVFNAGYTNSKILGCATNQEPVASGLLAYSMQGTHNALLNPILAPFARMENCALTIEWENGVDDNADGTFSCELKINYEPTTEPATVL